MKDCRIVSIILPIYNGYPNLINSIESIYSQNLSPSTKINIIIVNDGSTDYTKEYLDDKLNLKFNSASNIVCTIIHHPTNKGLSTALNTGLSNISKDTDFVTWTSDDNKYHPNAIQTMVDYLNSNLDRDMVLTGHEFFGERESKRHKKIRSKEQYLLNWTGICSFMWRKKVSDQIGFYDVGLNGVEDWDYSLRILQEFNNFGVIEGIYYSYQLHEGQLSKYMSKNDLYDSTETKMFNQILDRYNHDLFKIPLLQDILSNIEDQSQRIDNMMRIANLMFRNKKKSITNTFGRLSYQIYQKILELDINHSVATLALYKLSYCVKKFKLGPEIKATLSKFTDEMKAIEGNRAKSSIIVKINNSKSEDES